MPYETCPSCKGKGIDHPQARIDRGRVLREGDALMVAADSSYKVYNRAVITEFKHSPYKLLNDGDYTVVIQETGQTAHFPKHDQRQWLLFQCCDRCNGHKLVQLNDRDKAIADRAVGFLVSGRGWVNAVREGDEWVAYCHPTVRSKGDLLTLGDTVFRVTEHQLSVDRAYQHFKLEEAGDSNTTEYEPAFCEEHGWFEGVGCPDCEGTAPAITT